MKTAIGIEQFDAKLVLVDPKDRPKPENEEKIEAFCARLYE